MKRIIKKGSMDVTLIVFIQDSSSTTGAGLTGLAYNTSGLTCYYARERHAAAQLNLATQTVTGSHSDGGFVEIDATNMPGFYRLDLSDVICSAASPPTNSAVVLLRGAANMAPLSLELELIFWEIDATYPSVDACKISGDSTAADNLEAVLDGTGAVLTLSQLRIDSSAANGAIDIDNDAGPAVNAQSSSTDAVSIASTGGNGDGVSATGNGSGHGLHLTGGETGSGLYARGGATSGNGIYGGVQGTGGSGIRGDMGQNGDHDICGELSGIETTLRREIANEILMRDVSYVEEAAAEHSLCTIVLATLESAVSGNTWTIKRTDGSTTHATKTVATDPNADPITGVS